jgi:ABC-type uncharacterized transport system involved in gliding motility auxiliary subunit
VSKRQAAFLLSSLTFVAILVVITVIVNLIVSQMPAGSVRLDLTQNKEYTLSKATKNIFGRLKDLVTVKYYVSKDLPGAVESIRQDTVDFLNEVKRLAPAGTFKIVVVDPEEEAKETAAEREKRKKEVKDRTAKDGAEAKEEEDDTQFDPFTGQMSTKKRTEYEKVLDELAQKGVQKLTVRDIKQDAVSFASFYSAIAISYRGAEEEVIRDHRSLDNLEYELASRVLKLTLTEKEKPVVAFYNGQPKPPKPPDPRTMMPPQMPEEGEEEYAGLKQFLGELFSVKQVKLTEGEPIPPEAKTLILAQPKDLDRRQAAEVNRFVSSGGNLIVFAGNYTADLQTMRVMPVSTGLEDLLAQWGVKGDPRPVNSIQCGQVNIVQTVNTPLGRMRVPQSSSIPTHVLSMANNFDASSPFLRSLEVIVCPWAMALSVEGPETLKQKQLEASVLVKSDKNTWFGKKPAMSINDLMENGPKRGEELDKFQGEGPQNLVVFLRGTFPYAYEGKDLPAWQDKADDAAGDGKDKPKKPEKPVEKGHVAEPKGANALVIGSPDFCKDAYIREHGQRLYSGNYFFLRNVVEAFSLGNELIDIRAKQSARRPLSPDVSATTKSVLKLCNVLGMPILIAALGIVYAALRRRGSSAYERRVQEARAPRAGGTGQ